MIENIRLFIQSFRGDKKVDVTIKVIPAEKFTNTLKTSKINAALGNTVNLELFEAWKLAEYHVNGKGVNYMHEIGKVILGV